MAGYDLLEVLNAIDPARLTYEEWVSCGMALKEEGFSVSDWERWSARDTARYNPSDFQKKWSGFGHNGEKPVAGGYIVNLARDQGWHPMRQWRMGCQPYQGWHPMRHFKVDRAYGWDDIIGAHGGDLNVVENPDQLEQHPLPRLYPKWDPCRELTRYLELLFGPDEIVGYVASTWHNKEKDRYMPDRGVYTRTAGELIAALSSGDFAGAIGDTNPEAGAWIRFNPLDGKGIRNENVTEYRYALVESDSMPVEQQYAVYRALQLPARVLVHSGGKSLHAIVHIGAGSYNEYRDRVAYLYKVCEANGLVIDGQNKNPSRLSRMPGVMRSGKQQYIVAENTGLESFEAWREYIESVNDDLPDPQNLADVWDDLPPLSPPLIDGVLRQGHKMLLAGPSKAGKSFALMELCVAIAEGIPWLGFPCAQGRVLYVNLEVDPASCWHRLKDVYTALGVPPDNIRNLDVWNLRGSAVPMDKLAPKLIRRAQKRDYLAIVIDPIYKVITGDENSADQMAAFCNQFDLIASRLGCAVIYCHHHSKGAQGGKVSMDRASGSGVFARDPDTLLDMIELPVPESVRVASDNQRTLELCAEALRNSMRKAQWQTSEISPDDQCSAPRMLAICEDRLAPYEWQQLQKAVAASKQSNGKRTAWRIEGTLREFERFPPVDLWFEYPVHRLDEHGTLRDVKPEADQRGWAKGSRRNQQNAASRRQQKAARLDTAIQAANGGEPPTLAQLADYLDCSERTARDRIKESGKYVLDKNTRTILSA